MIASFSKGSNITAMVLYNENKVSKGTAELMFSNKFAVNKPVVYEETFKHLVSQSNMENPTFHASLNFSHADKLSPTEIESIANRYMHEMGYGNQPFVVYRHNDTKHDHVHIISVNIDEDNKRIPEWNDQYRSQKITREIEIDYNLEVVSSTKKENAQDLGEPKNFKSKVAKVALALKKEVYPEDFKQVEKYFASHGIEIAETGTKEGAGAGHIFRSTENADQKPIKASHLYHKFNTAVLENLYQKSAPKKKAFDRTKLAKNIRSIFSRPLSIGQATEMLAKINVIPLWDRYKDGTIYGLSFIDKNSGLIFKASELHRDLSYNRLKSILTEPGAVPNYTAEEIKKLVAGITNTAIREASEKQRTETGSRPKRSEVLKGISAETYRNIIGGSPLTADFSAEQKDTELAQTVEKRITWLTGSGINMAEASELMQVKIQDTLRAVNTEKGSSPELLLKEIEKITADVPGYFSSKNLLEDNPLLQQVYDRKDESAWNMALTGTHEFTERTLIERALNLYSNLNSGETFSGLISFQNESILKSDKESYSVQDLYFSGKGLGLVHDLQDYLSKYTKDEGLKATLIEKTFVQTINSTEISASLKNITAGYLSDVPKGEHAGLYFKLAKTPSQFFTGEKIETKTLAELYRDFDSRFNLRYTVGNYVKNHAEVLVNRGTKNYINEAVKELRTGAPGEKQSAFVESLTAGKLMATEQGKMLVEKLKEHYAELKLPLETAGQKISAIFENAVQFGKAGLPEIRVNELIAERFEEVYNQVAGPVNLDLPPLNLKRFMSDPLTAGLYKESGGLLAPFKDKAETDKHIIGKFGDRLIDKAIKNYYDGYLAHLKTKAKEDPSRGPGIYLEEAIKIKKSDLERMLNKMPGLLLIDPSRNRTEILSKMENKHSRLFDQFISQSFKGAFSMAYKDDLKLSKLKESEYLKGFNHERIVNNPAFISHMKKLFLELRGLGFKDTEINVQLNNLTKEFIGFKLDNIDAIAEFENSRGKNTGLANLFKVRGGVHKGLNDKKNKGYRPKF